MHFCTKFLYCFILKILVCAIMSGFRKSGHICHQRSIHGLAILCILNVGQSIHGICGYFAKGLSMGWPYYVCPMLVRVSMESADTLPRGIHGLAILCMSNVGQSIHGIHGYFAKGYPWVGHTMDVQCWSEYPWNPRILCQGGIHGLAILWMSNVGQSIHGIRGYFAKGVSMGWPYYACPMLVRVSMESADTLPRGIHGLAILCMSNIGQSIHGIHGYFAKGVSMGWPYYVCPTLVRVFMESADTLLRGYPWVGRTMHVQRWSEYPWNPQILCQGGIHGSAILCMSNIGQSIHGIRGYFAKGVSMGWPYYVCPMLVRVSMESADTLPRGIHGLAILCMSNVGQSIHGIRGYFAKGYPWVGHTMHVQCWSEYPWNPRILCQGVSMGWPYYVCPMLVRVSMESADTLPRGIHGLAILCMSNVGQSIHGIRGYFAKGYPWVGHTMYVQCWSEYPWNPRILCQGVSMGWPYYVCPMLVRVSMESADTLPRGIHGLAILCMSNVGQSIHGIRGYFAKGYPWVGHTMYVQCWSEYPWNPRILCQGVSMGWPYYVCPMLVRVSMESADTLPRGIHGLAILWMSNVGQSIHGVRGYFAKGGIDGLAIIYVCTM